MGKIKENLLKIKTFFETNTSGVPFLMWMMVGFSMIVFIFIFRKESFINFSKIIPLLIIASVWFVASDYTKVKKFFNPKAHFFFDSVFYILFFSGIFYLTGGAKGQLYFLTLIPAISAPFFSTFFSSVIFAFFLFASILAVHFSDATHLTNYNTGVILFQSTTSLAVVIIIGYFFNKIKSIQNERTEFAEKEVELKTAELRKTMATLDANRIAAKRKYEELEKFQKLVINREMKMIELKEKLADLEEKLVEKNKK